MVSAVQSEYSNGGPTWEYRTTSCGSFTISRAADLNPLLNQVSDMPQVLPDIRGKT